MKKKELIYILAVFGTFFLSACGGKINDLENEIQIVEQQEDEVVYNTIRASYADIVMGKSISCVYTQTTSYDLSFEIADREIQKFDWESGQMVQKGQLLAEVDLGELEEQLPAMEFAVENSRLALKHTQEEKQLKLDTSYILFTYGKMEKEDEDELKKKQEQIEDSYFDRIRELEKQAAVSQARLTAAKKQLEEGKIYAPVTGEITYVMNLNFAGGSDAQGARNYSKIGERVFTISELSNCYFSSTKLEYMDYFPKGESFQIKISDSGEYVYYKIVPANRENWEKNGVMQFALAEEGDVVSLGTSGTVEAQPEERPHVFSLPKDAVHKTETEDFVYVLEDGVRRMKTVETGVTGSGKIEILSGITQNDLVIVKEGEPDENHKK